MENMINAVREYEDILKKYKHLLIRREHTKYLLEESIKEIEKERKKVCIAPDCSKCPLQTKWYENDCIFNSLIRNFKVIIKE